VAARIATRLLDVLGLPPGIALPADEKVAHRAPGEGDGRALDVDAAATIRRWYSSDYDFVALLEELGFTSRPGGPA
jgi:hypothetical protein